MARAKSDAGNKTAIVVAGMHRSGTSSLTKILSAYGFKLPRTLLEANKSNEAGFWESVAINRLNDKIFHAFDTNWRSWQPLPTDWTHKSSLTALRKEALDTLREEFDGAPSILLKDPRFCRLMPFWLPVLEEFQTQPVIVCPIRNPLESAVSLEQRNGLPQALGLLIWLRYQLEVEYDTRGRPRSFTHYNALLDDWRKVINKIFLETACTLPKISSETEDELGTWLSPKLRHHLFPDATILHDSIYPEWVRSAYKIFLKWTQTKEDETDFKSLDRIRNELNEVPDSLRGILDIGQANIDDVRRLRKKLESQETQLEEITRQQAKREASARFFEEQFAQAKINAESTMKRLAELDTAASLANDRLQESKSELEAAFQRNKDLSKQLSQSELNLATIKGRQTDTDDRSRRLEQQYENMLRQLAQLEAEANLFAERTKEREKALENLDQVAKELRQQLTVREATMVERERRLEELTVLTKELRRLLATQEVAIAARDQKVALFEQRHEEQLHQLAQFGAEASLYAERTTQFENEREVLRDITSELKKKLETRDAVIAERERNIALITQQQEANQQRLAQLGAEASKYEERTAQLERELESLNDISKALKQQLEVRDGVIAERAQELVSIKQQQIENLQKLRQVEAEAKYFAEKSADQEQSLKELNAMLGDLQNQLAIQNSEISERDKNIEAIEQQRCNLVEQLSREQNEALLYKERYLERQRASEELGDIARELQQQLAERDAANIEADKKSALLEQQHNKVLQLLAEREVETKLVAERSLAVERSLEDMGNLSRELEQRLAGMQATNSERESQIEEIRQQRDNAYNQLAQKDNEARLYNERYIERQKTLEELGKISDELQQQLAERDAEIIKREQELAQIVHQRDESLLHLMKLEEEIKDSSEQIIDLQKSIDTFNLLSIDLRQQLVGYETALSDRDIKLSEAEQQRIDMLQLLAKKEEEAWLYSELYDEQRQTVEKLSFASTELEQRIAKRDATIGERDHELMQVQQQLEQLAVKLSQKEAETQLNAIKAAEQEQLLESLNAISNEMKQKLAMQRRISSDLGQTISQLENDNNELLQNFESNKSKIKDLTVQISEQKQTIEDLNKSNHELISRYTTLRSEADVLKSKLLDTRKKRDITISEREIAKRKLGRLENELSGIRSSRIWKIHKATAAALYRLNAFLPTKSGRLQRQLLATIKASQYFDKNWYLERYPDVSETNIDPAEHYIRFGADELRDPGPTFSTRFYVERYPDISKTGINALYHYERYGNRERRKIAPAQSPDRSSRPATPLEPITNQVLVNKNPTTSDSSFSIQTVVAHSEPTSMPAKPAEADFRWLSQRDLSRISGESMIELGNLKLARSTDHDEAATSKSLISMQVFAMLTDMPDLHALRLRQGDQTAPLHDCVADLTQCNIHSFLAVPVLLDAIWYANARDLRIRFNAAGLANTQNVVVRGYQYDPAENGGLVLVGEHALRHEIIQIADFALFNPYLPVLLTLTTPEAHLLDAAVLPFPSLCPGGAHEAEGLAVSPSVLNDLPSIARELLTEHLHACEQGIGWALSRLLVDIRTATGAERIFSADIKEWLWSVFALQLEGWHMPTLAPDTSAYWSEILTAPQSMQNEARLQRQARRALSGQKMVCPANAIPSIHALTTSRAEGGLQRICAPGAYVMTQSGNANIRWLVDVPPFARNPDRALMLSGHVRHPFVDQADVMSDSWRVGAPIAILERDMRPRHVSQMIMPIAPEISHPLNVGIPSAQAKTVSIVITASNIGEDVFAAMLESIQIQRGIDIIEVVVAALPRSESSDQAVFAALLQRFFPRRHVLVDCPAGEEYADRAHRAASLANSDSANLLFINSPLVLHDPRTLDTLVQLVCMDHVATASCMQIGALPSAPPGHPVHSLFSGIFPIRKSGMAQTECEDFDAQALFPLDVYPVASVGDALFLIRADLWRSSNGFLSVQSKDSHAAVELSLTLAARGMTHLLTTLVSAELQNPQQTGKLYSLGATGYVPDALRNTSICFEVLPA